MRRISVIRSIYGRKLSGIQISVMNMCKETNVRKESIAFRDQEGVESCSFSPVFFTFQSCVSGETLYSKIQIEFLSLIG